MRSVFPCPRRFTPRQRWTSLGKSSWNSCLSRGVYGHWTSQSLHWKQASITACSSAAVIWWTSPSWRSSMALNSSGKLSQYLKHMRQPWQISKARWTSPARASGCQ